MSEQAKSEPSTAKRASGVVVASGVAALSSLLITIIAARSLPDPADYAEFLVFWSLYYAAVGVIAGMQSETTRAVSAAGLRPAEQRGAPVLRAAWLVGGVAAALVLASAPLWLPAFLDRGSPIVAVIVAVGVLMSAGYFTLIGALSGRERWGSYAWLYGLESALRLVLIGVLGVVALGQLLPLQIATAVPTFLWLAFAFFSKSGREAAAARADVAMGPLLRQNLLAMGSATATAVLVVGYPAIVRVTDDGTAPAVLAGTILAITLTRAPIMIPLLALQSVAINQFTVSGGRDLGMVFRPMALVAGLGVVGGVLAALLGPWLIRTLYGSNYQVDALTLGLLTVAAAGMGWLVLTGAAALAISSHGFYTGGWAAAAVCAVLLSLLPLGLPGRAIVALAVGPLVGVAIHLIALLRHRRRLAAAG